MPAPPRQSPPKPPSDPADRLWPVLEKQADEGNINLPYVVRMYTECVGERPLLRLIQDIEQRIGIYCNILEEVKRARTPNELSAKELRQRYESLGLVPEGHLPNPYLTETAKYALGKLRIYGDSLVSIMTEYSKDIKKELKIAVNVKLNISVSLSLSPSISLEVQDDSDS